MGHNFQLSPFIISMTKLLDADWLRGVQLYISLRGSFFRCRVLVIKSVQNPKSFWCSSQNCFVLALFSSLYSYSYIFSCI